MMKSLSTKAFYILLFFLFFIFLWMVVTKVDVVVKASGKIIPFGYAKNIASLQTNFVSKINVKEGDFVKKGDILIELDNKAIKQDLNNSLDNYYMLLAKRDRLISELNNSTKINFQENIPTIYIVSEKNILKNHLEYVNYQIKLLDDQITQLNNEILKLKYENTTNNNLLSSYKKELDILEPLYKKKYTQKDKILELKRKIIQLEGKIKQNDTDILKNKNKIKELKNKKKFILLENKKKLYEEYEKTIQQIQDTKKNLISLKDKLNKTYIKANETGIVSNLTIHATGELVKSGNIIMWIVPNKEFIVEVKVSPLDIDKVKKGNKAQIMFSSYVNPIAKEITGKVTYIAAKSELSQDKKSSYYKVLIKLDKKGKANLLKNNFKLVADMPVNVYITAEKERVIYYLLYPVKMFIKGIFHAN